MAFLTRVTWRHWVPGIALVVIVMFTPGVAHALAQQTLENDVKAAFLFNFTKFVDWPPSAFEGPSDPVRICVIADAAFTASVDRTIAGETVRGRPLQRIVPDVSELPRCHVLYIGAAETERAGKLLSPLGRAPVLTVGETGRFLDHGGAISFILAEDRVRFEVNLKAADRSGLTISSKLLRVARDIRERDQP